MNNPLPQIQNIVYLMMENRSLDNVLGWLYEDALPTQVYPPGSSPRFDGLIKNEFYNPAHAWDGVKQYPVEAIPSRYEGERVPCYDPYEAMREGSGAEWNGVMNQLFGNQDRIDQMPNPKQHASMLGFLQDYYAYYMTQWQGLDALWSYTPKQLPVLNWLARSYAVSDRWFSSVPSQTNPNRAYSLCGTSLGREANANLQALEQFDAPTVINALANAGKSWGLYYEDIWHDQKCYTDYTFPHIRQAKSGEIQPMATFLQHARNGTLPAFCYLEPKWGYGKGSLYVQGHDYHPPTDVSPGDNFLRQVYQALRSSPQWANSLLIVSFDEHGGTYDHVAPPWGAINPDGKNGSKWGFTFNLYGVRVPTLLISPFVAAGTVFRQPEDSAQPLDHTAFIKTMLLWAGIDPNNAGLGKRVIAAPSFADVLSDKPINEQSLPPTVASLSSVQSQAINALFDGIPFACVRELLHRSRDLVTLKAEIARFKADPDAFTRSLLTP